MRIPQKLELRARAKFSFLAGHPNLPFNVRYQGVYGFCGWRAVKSVPTIVERLSSGQAYTLLAIIVALADRGWRVVDLFDARNGEALKYEPAFSLPLQGLSLGERSQG